MFGILRRTLLKELLLTFVAVFVILLLITFGSEVTRVLAQAVEGKLPPELVLDLMGFKLIRAQDLVLPLVALIAVMLTFGRMHQDQEITVMQSCGVSPNFFKLSVVLFLIPMTAILSFLMIVVYPWSYQNERLLINEALMKNAYAKIEAKTFTPLPNAQGVIYAQQVDEQGGMKQVWVRYQSEKEDLILVAEAGRLSREENQFVLHLEQGWRYSNLHHPTNPQSHAGHHNAVPFEVQSFESFEGVLPKIATRLRSAKVKELSMTELWQAQGARERMTFHNRLTIPLGILIMGLVGLRLSKTGPRQGRFAKLFVALLLFIIYNQLHATASDFVKEGAHPVVIWMVPVVFLLWALEWDQKLLRRLRLIKPSRPSGTAKTIKQDGE